MNFYTRIFRITGIIAIVLVAFCHRANASEIDWETIIPGKDAPAVQANVSTDTTFLLHGEIVDEKGIPIPGASVKINQTGRGVTTDNKGEFVLRDVSNNATLVASYVGYQQVEIKIKGQEKITIRLKLSVNELGGVIVSTGYQDMPKERATGSFAKIDNAMLNQQVGSNILSRLDGVASGVLFPKQDLQDGPDFMVRGLSTINGPKSPLIVVDNFPYDGDINNINPNDVESVTILKDAAATSIWGTRAGNGVVVITTKKGRFNQPIKVDFNTNIRITGKPNLSSLRVISSNDYINIEQQLFSNGYYDGYLNDTYTYPAVSPVVEILNDERNGSISPENAAAQINHYRGIDARDQYSKYMYQQVVMQQYAVNLHGGSGNIAYYLSAGYDKTLDQLDAASDRLTIRSENQYRPLKSLQLNLGMQYTGIKNSNGRPTYGSVRTGQWQIPYLQLADAHGNPLPDAIAYRQAYTDTVGAGKLLDWNYYPLSDWKYATINTTQEDLLANLGLSYQITRGLSFDAKYTFERQTGNTDFLQGLQSYQARDLINSFSQLDRSTGSVTYIVPLGGILNLSNSNLESQNIRGQFSFDDTWGKHNVTAIAGNEIRQVHTTGNSSAFYGYDGNTLVTANIDPVNAYPTIFGYYSNVPLPSGLSDQLNRYVSFYGNAAYTYAAKYIFSISGRRDASNLFGVSTNNKWTPLWSAGTGWIISNESFYHIGWLDYLKFRATYGFSGNADPTRSGTTVLVLGNAGYPTNLPTSRVNQFPNPNLRWEKVRQLNFGFDFSVRRQLITGTFEAYLKKGIDLFGASPTDPTAGLNDQSVLMKNIANMKGSGIDVVLNSKNINKKFKWNSTLLFNYYTSRTTNYYIDSNRRSNSLVNNGYLISPLSGKPLYSIVAFRWAGLSATGNPQGYLNKGISTDYYNIVSKTRKEDFIYRSSLPVFFGSLINTFDWKGIELTINVNYRFGYYFLKSSVNYSSLYNNGSSIGSSDFSKRWQQPGDEKITNVPSMIYPADNNRDFFYTASEALIDKADNIKLQYINLSYDIDKAIGKSFPFHQLQLYINISDLGILWKANKDGIDPDYISTTPTPGRTYTIGVKANF